LIETRPEEWARCFARLTGIPPGPATALDTDLATTLQADRVFRIDGEKPSLLHLELEGNPRLGIPRELMRYNTFIDHQYDLPVETVLILLRPKAIASDLTGLYQRLGASGQPISTFRYRVEKVWERSISYWLDCGPGLAALSVLTDEASRDLKSAVGQLADFAKDRTADDTELKSIMNASYMLCGLRYPSGMAKAIFKGLNMLMEDSTTYQDILNEGRNEEGKAVLLSLATQRFGIPSPERAERLQSVNELSKIRSLTQTLLIAADWDDFLKTI